MKKILFILSKYKLGERFLPVVPKLINNYQCDVLKIQRMDECFKWNGDFDPRLIFSKLYESYFNNVYNYSLDFKHMDFSRYDAVIIDDCVNKSYWKNLYYMFKRKGVIVIGNEHGNGDMGRIKNYISKAIGSICDYLLVFGKKELEQCTTSKNKKYVRLGGIPANDKLKEYSKGNSHILVIVNSIGRKDNNVFPINFDNDFIRETDLMKLQSIYSKKILIKLKNRVKRDDYEGDCEYVKSLFPHNANIEIMLDTYDDNKMICDSICVVSAPSTLAFKSIQKGIPTVCIKGSGQTGSFYDYFGLLDMYKDNVVNNIFEQFERGRDLEFINGTLEGGVDFNSVNIYIDRIGEIVGEKERS